MPHVMKKKRKGFYGKRKWELERLSDRGENSASSVQQTCVAGTNDGPNSFFDELARTPSSSGNREIIEMPRNLSAEKLVHSNFKQLDHRKSLSRNLRSMQIEEACSNKIQDFSILNQCLQSFAMCSSCKSAKSRIILMQDNQKKMGLAEFLFRQCTHCGAQKEFTASRKLPGKGGAFEVNRQAILACPSRSELKRFCTKMNLPPPLHKEAYNAHIKQIEKELSIEAEKKMNEAAIRLKDITKIKDSNKVKISANGQEIAEVAGSVDGTWQKRGHSSKIGVVSVLSIRTGEVLDYEVLSHFCQECNSHDETNDTIEYKKWKEKHAPLCHINHYGSSGDMECKGAIAILKEALNIED